MDTITVVQTNSYRDSTRLASCAVVSVVIGIASCFVAAAQESKNPKKDLQLAPIATAKHRFEVGGQVTSLAFSPDGKFLAVGSLEHNLVIFDLTKGKEHARILHEKGTVYKGFAFTPDGKQIAVNLSRLLKGKGIQTKVYDANSGQEIVDVKVTSLLVFYAGKKEVIEIVHPMVQVRDTKDDRVIREFNLQPDQLRARQAIVSADGRFVAADTFFSDKAIHLWSTSSGKEIAALKGHGGIVEGIRFSTSGKWIATAGGDKNARIWNTADGALVREISTQGVPNRVAFSPDEKLLAVSFGAVPNEISIRDTASGNELLALKRPPGFTNVVEFDFSGKMLAASTERAIQVWELTSKKQATEK